MKSIVEKEDGVAQEDENPEVTTTSQETEAETPPEPEEVKQEGETNEQRWKRIQTRFDAMDDLVYGIINELARSLIISGPPGLGKSWNVEKALKEWDPTGSEYEIVRGKTTPGGLLQLIWAKRFGGVLIFDDCDAVFADETALNFLKVICDTTEERWVSYRSAKPMFTPEGEEIENKFKFDGRVIFLTNYDFYRMVEKDTKFSPHFAALMSRSHYIDLDMRGYLDYMTRIQMVIQEGLLDHLNEEQREDVENFLIENFTELTEMSLRSAIKAGDIRRLPASKSGLAWHEIAKVTLCKNRRVYN